LQIIMACVRAGLSRQDAHEEIRVLSHQAAEQVKVHGKANDLIERVRTAPFFAPIVGQLDSLLDANTFTGRSGTQVRKFVASGGEVAQALQKYGLSVEGSDCGGGTAVELFV